MSCFAGFFYNSGGPTCDECTTANPNCDVCSANAAESCDTCASGYGIQTTATVFFSK